MSNVVHLNVPSPKDRETNRQSALLRCFAQHRRFGDDVFWLKENAELLNILECTGAATGAGLSAATLDTHAGFYAQVEKRLGFFPQYYRFLLSICLDLEDLGMEGDKGAALVEWVAAQGLAEAELSDLQRGEARRLMGRRGIDPLPGDPGLDDRLRGFIARSATFAMPNKKAAYELTHTIFYLSEYGRKDPLLPDTVRDSLDFAGTLAYLDQNADLLAELCLAMRYGGITPPQAWENWLAQHTRGFTIETGPQASPHDDYHEYFVCNWLLATTGQGAFGRDLAPERMSFFRPESVDGPLRDMSECMFRLEDERCGEWQQMRPLVLEGLSEPARAILGEAESASACFESFFEGFARVGLRGVRL